MPTINQLNATDVLTSSDLFPVFSQQNGDARKAAASVVLAYIQDNITSSSSTGSVVQHAYITGNDSITIESSSANVWLICLPNDPELEVTIVLPTSPADGQTITLTFTEITYLLYTSTSTLVGFPCTVSGARPVTVRYDDATDSWYRIG